MNYFQELAIKLKYYNEWRRGKHQEQPNPNKIGVLLDEVCNVLNDLRPLDVDDLNESNESNELIDCDICTHEFEVNITPKTQFVKCPNCSHKTKL